MINIWFAYPELSWRSAVTLNLRKFRRKLNWFNQRTPLLTIKSVSRAFISPRDMKGCRFIPSKYSDCDISSVAMLMFWATARTIKRRFPPKYTNDREHQSKLFYCSYYWYNFTKLVWRWDSMLAVLSLCLLIALCSSNRRGGWRLRKIIQKYRVFTP